MSNKKKKTSKPLPQYYLCSIKSGRGTEIYETILVSGGLSKDELREVVDTWATERLNGSAVSFCSVSYQRIKIPAKGQLLAKISRAAAKHSKARAEWLKAQSMLYPKDCLGW